MSFEDHVTGFEIIDSALSKLDLRIARCHVHTWICRASPSFWRWMLWMLPVFLLEAMMALLVCKIALLNRQVLLLRT